MTRVLVIDDHPIVLQGCRQLLVDAGVNQIVQAQSLAEGFKFYRTQKPDVIIVDLATRSGTLSGLSFIRRLRLYDNHTPVLVFTMHSDTVIVSNAIELGATGYLLKDASPDEFLKAFQRVSDGKTYISHDLATDLAFNRGRERTNLLRNLSLRELEMLSLLAEGKPYGVIAENLNVSYKTVANTAVKLKAKLGVRTLIELTRLATDYSALAASQTEVSRANIAVGVPVKRTN
jgi:DNA-binding NarL/FixJ family response regulator